MTTDCVCPANDSLRDALQAEAALALLDAAAAPPHIGAHLNLAIFLLSEALSRGSQTAPPHRPVAD